jgi:MFS family permease
MLPWTAAAMVISPIAGRLAGRYCNRPFITAGLLLQAAGLAWIAAVATPGLGYAEPGPPLTVAGVGIGLVFPTVATEVMSSVPAHEIGVASGANSALRELGGVFGVAVLASVFARPGVYTSPAIFVAGFQDALWAGAALSAVGALIATSVRQRPAHAEDRPSLLATGGLTIAVPCEGIFQALATLPGIAAWWTNAVSGSAAWPRWPTTGTVRLRHWPATSTGLGHCDKPALLLAGQDHGGSGRR